MITNIGVFLNSAPPLNLTVNTLSDGYEYNGNTDETINCTATINPNITVLFSIGYFFAEKKNVQTFVYSENNIGCYQTVKTVFKEIVDFLKIYDHVGCLASDTVSGQTSVSEFETVLVMIDHR